MNKEPRKVAVLGSTGSIGVSTLKVLRDYPDDFQAVALAAYGNIEALKEQTEEFSPSGIYLADEEKYYFFRNEYQHERCQLFSGSEGMEEMLASCRPDIVVVATVGFTGVKPVLWSIKNRIPVALANKEVLVVAGDLVRRLQEQYQTPLYPVDSEHSAIFQCLQGEREHLRKILLTASGGPFHKKPRENMENAGVQEVLNHPTWDMGKKITVDSATMINKGFEVIEAHYLFDLPPSRIQVVVHPQSVVHSMVELVDNTVLAHLSPTDMYYPVLYALAYPRRLEVPHKEPLDFFQLPQLTFSKPDPKSFPCLQFAYDCLEKKRGYPVAFNAANEVAVASFLEEKITFLQIAELIEQILEAFSPVDVSEFDIICKIDEEVRKKTSSLIKAL